MEPARRPPTLAVALLAAAIVAVLGGGTAALLTHEPAPVTGGRTPEIALRGYYEGLAAGDCPRAARFVDPGFLSAEELCRRFEQTVAASGSLVRIVERHVGDETATLIAERDVGGLRDRRIVRLRRTGDRWRLAGGSSCYPPRHPTDLGTTHLEEGSDFDDYSSTPPTSGPHDPVPTDPGVYRSPRPLPKVVHSMEHGAVVFWLGDAPDAMLGELGAALGDLVGEGYGAVIVTPLPELDVPFAMTAWGTLQRCLGVSVGEVRAFVETYYGSGGEGELACGGPASDLPPCAPTTGR